MAVGPLRGSRRRRSSSLFVRARQDPSTFGEVYDEYHPQVLAYFARRVLDPEVAFDLMAETFAEVFAALREFRGGSEDEGRKWMWTIARHQLYQWREKGAVERRNLGRLGWPVASLGPQEYDRIEELADVARMRPALSKALATLSAEDREVLQQRVINNRGYDEIAMDYGVTPVAIRVRVSRALRRLSEALAAAGEFDEKTHDASEELLT